MVLPHVNTLYKYFQFNLRLQSILNMLLIRLKTRCNIIGNIYEIILTVKTSIYLLLHAVHNTGYAGITIDECIKEKNIEDMHRFAQTNKVRLRPHTKTQKMCSVAKMQ